ncbi:Clp protease N-terminal domain-containing protein [Saccharopolyspora cebuensis]|uniref:Clp protease N-terminal domain-containing protein n=1 Tax=Saccharopolyspora cebuensis TaxID=418759 RepID=A0ABV4CJ60_9PSEU
MFERFAADTRRAVRQAVEEARRQERDEIGEEHLLLALLRDRTREAGALLAGRGVRSAEVEDAYARSRRRGGLSEAESDSLHGIGIDVREVMAAVERSHGAEALVRRRRRRRGLFAGHRPFTAEAKAVLERSLREALEHGDRSVRELHLLLALRTGGGVAAEVLAERGVDYAAVLSSVRRSA